MITIKIKKENQIFLLLVNKVNVKKLEIQTRLV